MKTGFTLVITSHALNHAYNSLLPILYPSMISEFGLSYGLLGILIMGYRLTSGSLQLLAGFMSRFLRRKTLLGLGLIWQSAANSFMVVSQRFEHILICRTFSGVGSSPQHPIGTSYISETFPKGQLGKALGVNIVAARIGSFVVPLVGSLILANLGWKTTLLVFSIPGMLIGIAFLFIAESRRSQKSSSAFNPTQLFGEVREVLRDRTVLIVMVVEMVMAFRIGASDFLPSYFARDLSMASLEAGMFFSIFLGSGIPAPYFWGALSDRLERRKVIMVAMSIACILWFLLSYSKNSFHLLLILVPLGFSGQGVGGVIQAFVAEATTQENCDLVYGIYFTLAFTLSSFSATILGHLVDSFSFQVGFSCVALISLSAVIAAYFLRVQ